MLHSRVDKIYPHANAVIRNRVDHLTESDKEEPTAEVNITEEDLKEFV